MKSKQLLTILLLITLSISTVAQTNVEKEICTKDIDEINTLIRDSVQGSFGIDVEQDWLVCWLPGLNEDRNYTHGTAFSYSKPGLEESILFTPFNIIEKLNRKRHRKQVYINYPAKVAFGVTAFTPLKIDSINPIIGDRPFGGIVFLTTEKNRFNLRTKLFTTTSFNYGLLGTNVTNTFQSWMHAKIITGRPSDISWEHQVSRGGHFAFMFSHSAVKSVCSFPKKDSTENVDKWIDLTIGYKMNLGWYTGMSGLSTLRIGKISNQNIYSPGLMNSNNPANKNVQQSRDTLIEINSKLQSFNKAIKPDKKQKGLMKQKKQITKFLENLEETSWDAYFFASFNPRMTVYNSMILGQPNVESIYTLEYEDYNPFIADFEWGAVVSRLTFKKCVFLPVKRFDLILSVNHRTPEIRNEEFKRWHHWGRISIRFPLF